MKEDIEKCLKVLQSGGSILYPTDTIWGIGCDATNEEAVKKIYNIKQREDSKSLLVLLDNKNLLTQYTREVPEMAWELIEASHKPLTIIYPGVKNLAGNLVAEDGSIGIRVTSDEFCNQLIRRFKKPIVSTSANISGKPAPEIFPEISPCIMNAVDYIVQWRQDELFKNVPSSIIKLSVKNEIKIIRK